MSQINLFAPHHYLKQATFQNALMIFEGVNCFNYGFALASFSDEEEEQDRSYKVTLALWSENTYL